MIAPTLEDLLAAATEFNELGGPDGELSLKFGTNYSKAIGMLLRERPQLHAVIHGDPNLQFEFYSLVHHAGFIAAASQRHAQLRQLEVTQLQQMYAGEVAS